MALYQEEKYLKAIFHTAFDIIHRPGDLPQNSGIYRCETCGREIVSEKGKPMPLENHHQHAEAQGSIQWRLIVATQ